MHKEYSTFFRLLRSIARYSCDASLLDDPHLHDEVDEDEEYDLPGRPLILSSFSFLEELYEPRGVEEYIIASLRRRSSLLCLVGAQGAGKTTLGFHVRAEIGRRWPSTFMTFLDLRFEIANRAIDTADATSLERTLRSRLISEYQQRLFPLRRDDISARARIWAYILDAAVEKPLNLFASFMPLQDAATRLLRIYDGLHRGTSKLSVSQWLEQAYERGDSEVVSLTAGIDKTIDFSHLAYAASQVLRVTRQLIWLDNIDALPDDLQGEAVDAVRRIYHPVSQYISMLVAVREENIFRDHDIADVGAPPYETRVLLDMPRTVEGAAFYPAHDVPIESEQFLRAMVRRRLDAARKYQQKRVEELKAERAKLAKSASIDGATERILEIDADLNDLSPVISSTRFNHVVQAAERLQTALHHERAIHVTNNSLRNYLFIVRDTLADMFREEEDVRGIPPAVIYPEWHVATLFLRRVRNTARRYQVGMYDVLREIDAQATNPTREIACILPYLVLTTTWNITLKTRNAQNRYGSTPSIGDVEKALGPLGYEPAEIRKAMHEQYFRNNTRQNLLDFRTRSVIKASADLEPDVVVYITFRGKCLVARTSNSFGYLYDCLRGLEGSDEPDILAKKLTIHSVDDVVERLLPYLCDMGDLHYRALREIRDTARLGEQGWLLRYYREFGTPHIEPYARSSPGGRVIDGIRRTLLLEGILGGLLSFLKSPGLAKDKVLKLSNAFAAAVNNLEAGGDPVQPPFRQIIGIPRRRKGGAREQSESTRI